MKPLSNELSLARTIAIALLAFIITSTLIVTTVAQTEDPPPNIVLVMTDDQGFGDLGVHGNRIINTPHIDALANRGTQMTDFYVCPVCTPTRACLMTGRYQYRTRAIDTYVGRAMMEPEEVTVAELLREAGYATGIFGKWHLGDNYPLRPQDQGFNEVLVHRGGGIGQPSDPLGAERKYTDPVLVHNGRLQQFTGYCTDIYFDHAIRFVQQQHQAGKPFFVYIPTNAPHGPYHDVPSPLYEKYKQTDLSPVLLGNDDTADRVARIYAMIENIDQNFGRLVEALQALEATHNTIVIFMCDNGPNTRRYVGNMQGMKGEVLEGGIRSPFFIEWPAKLQGGKKISTPAAHIDAMPTLLAAASVAVPDSLHLDGRSLLPLLTGDVATWPVRPLVLQWHRGNEPQMYRHFAMRQGKWKLLNNQGRAEPWNDGTERPESILEDSLELYDLQADPREQHNVINENPEIASQLRAVYEKWFKDVSSTRPDNYAPPRMILGSEQQSTVVLTRQDWRRSQGDGWGERGAWHLDVLEEKQFDITVRLAKPFPVESGNVLLEAEGFVATMVIRQGENQATIQNVTIPPGKIELTATIEGNDKPTAPHQVVVSTVSRRR